MKVLGLDPGTLSVGFGLLREEKGKISVIDMGVVKAPTRMPLPERLAVIFKGIEEVVRVQRPDVFCVEKIFFGANVKSAISLGEGRGVALLAAGSHGIEVHEFSATEIKKAVTGYGKAHKTQVQIMIKSLLGLNEIPKPDDTADALAAAYCFLNRRKFKQKIISS